MDKTFEDIISETLQDLDTGNEGTDDSQVDTDLEGTTESDDNQVDAETVDDEPVDDETVDDKTVDDETVDDESKDDEADDEVLDEEVIEPGINQKDAKAFARMRTELKQSNEALLQSQEIINFFDEKAKQMGLAGIEDLMEKTKEADLNKQAEERGIPVDVLKRLDELEDRVREQDIEKEELEIAKKEQSINHTFEKFMQNHSLGTKEVDKLADDLFKDGFSLEVLMDMPESAVSKILESYIPSDVLKQESIAKKEQIKKEVPPTGNSSSTTTLDDEIDKIAKMWANTY